MLVLLAWLVGVGSDLVGLGELSCGGLGDFLALYVSYADVSGVL
jgi:hypothetical protein